MKQIRKALYVILVVLVVFLAVTAILGGIGILTGINVPSVEELKSSIFQGVTIPGLALLLIVGGGASWASMALIRKLKLAMPLATAAGLTILFFEFVEVLIIGSPAGVAQNLQILYFGVGTLIVAISICIWGIDLLAD